MSSQPLARFSLSHRIHTEFGWTELVRHFTTRNRDVIGYLVAHPEILPRCDDPHTLLESWWPLGNLTVYFIRRRDGNTLAEWVTTDGVFSQTLPALRSGKRAGPNDEPQFAGMLSDVLDIARKAWEAAEPGKPFPLLPGPSGLPEAVILHRYELNEAFISPYAATMAVLESKELL
jgi:hypothetical protein